MRSLFKVMSISLEDPLDDLVIHHGEEGKEEGDISMA